MIEAPLPLQLRNGPLKNRSLKNGHCRLAFTLCLLLATAWQPAQAQFDFGGFGGRGGSDTQVTVESQFTPATADRPALLFVSATIAKGFHVYAIDQGRLPNDGGGPMPTQISLASDSGAQLLGAWQPIAPPKTHIDQEIWTGLQLREHEKQVTWFAPIKLIEGVDLASLTITGKIEGQACNPATCIPFEATLTAQQGAGVTLPAGIQISTNAPSNTNAASSTPVPSSPAAILQPSTPQHMAIASVPSNLYDLSQISLTESQEGSLVYYLITAFLGGIILNVMPCVLPVIGLKVMSFVQQAGQNRAHAFALNVWYSAGIVIVFLVLAGLAVTLQLGWGGQFGSAGFNIVLIGVVFAMALSLLGMWDIPIPGFVGSGTALEVTEREGPTAAFLKGILTTLLATPCIGPFMAPALAWAVKQEPWMTFSVFGVLGLGMASPYLLIGAFPQLVRFLPKPGAWMENFKKIMGLVLLATVVWLLTFIESPLVVPTVALMVGIAAGCWWVSQTPITAPLNQKAYGWVTGVMIVVISAMASYGWLYRDVMKPRFEKNIAKFAEQQIGEDRLRIANIAHEMSLAIEPQTKTATTATRGNFHASFQTSGPDTERLHELIAGLATQAVETDDQGWQSFSLAKLGQITLGEGRTVLVDFTADWCLTCKTLEKLVLKTQPVEEAITLADVVTMEADYTNTPEPLKRTIKALGGSGVPLIAIFPASDPYHPIVFSDGQYTKSALIEAIAQATGRKDLLQGKTGGSAALSQNDANESRR